MGAKIKIILLLVCFLLPKNKVIEWSHNFPCVTQQTLTQVDGGLFLPKATFSVGRQIIIECFFFLKKITSACAQMIAYHFQSTICSIHSVGLSYCFAIHQRYRTRNGLHINWERFQPNLTCHIFYELGRAIPDVFVLLKQNKFHAQIPFCKTFGNY